MSIPHYIILSDSEDEYPPIPTVDLPDYDSDIDMDISSSMLGSHVASHFSPTSDDEIVTHPAPTADEPMETDPSEEEEEEEPSEEDPSEEEIETTTTPTPVVTLPTAPSSPPFYYRRHGPLTRTTARKSVRLPRQELTEPIDDTRVFYTDIYVDTTTPVPPITTSIPTTTPTTTATPAPHTGSDSRRQDWLHTTLQTWRNQEDVPSTYEIGESSSAPSMASIIPLLVARLVRQERDQQRFEEDFGRYTSRNNDAIREHFVSVRGDAHLTEQALGSLHSQLVEAQYDIAILRSRVEAAERHSIEDAHRIAAWEDRLRSGGSTSHGASASGRPGHPHI